MSRIIYQLSQQKNGTILKVKITTKYRSGYAKQLIEDFNILEIQINGEQIF